MDTALSRRTNVRAAALSIASNLLLMLLKIGAGIITGSVGILAEAIHSGIDLLASVIAFFSVRVSAKPADREHPFGHGKVENISGTAEAILIFVAAALIIYESVQRIFTGSQLETPEIGIAIMAFSMVANFAVSRYLLKVSRRTDSLAIEADAGHLTTDIATSAGVLLGLLAVRITGIRLLDPIMALVIAAIIMRTAYKITTKSFGGLVDVRLPPEEEKIVADCIMEHFGELIGFHELRTRKAGIQRYIELHLVMSRTSSLEDVHRMCDHLEADIVSKLPHTEVTIHVEPCEMGCHKCDIRCPLGIENVGKK